ncbi:ABC transporter permease [Nocardioides sp. LHG3406-4]|uniref:ABC transporter permease n=1 Tax=Nocardioides sp. LHG3406-4 TaxID=2804575 RepID=UPI003CEA653A
MLVAIGLVALWFFGAHQLGPMTMPSPTVVLGEIVPMLQSEVFVSDLRTTMSQILIALVLALVLGTGCGVLGWRFRSFRSAVFPWLSMLNTVPPVLLYPVAIIFFGLGTGSTVLLSIFLGGMVMTESTYAGLRSVERVHLEVASIFRASRVATFRKVLLPGALDIIATGLRVGFTLVFIVVIATGYILSGVGLGYRLRFYYESFAMSQLYALVILIIALSLACQVVLMAALRLVRSSDRATSKGLGPASQDVPNGVRQAPV